MVIRKQFLNCLAVASAPLLLALATAPLLAQQTEGGITEIIVTAPNITHEVSKNIGSYKVPITHRMDAKVSYADLDLGRTSDVQVLAQRIELAANQLCTDLAKEFPFGEPRMSKCVADAVDSTKGQVEEAVGGPLTW